MVKLEPITISNAHSKKTTATFYPNSNSSSSNQSSPTSTLQGEIPFLPLPLPHHHYPPPQLTIFTPPTPMLILPSYPPHFYPTPSPPPIYFYPPQPQPQPQQEQHFYCSQNTSVQNVDTYYPLDYVTRGPRDGSRYGFGCGFRRNTKVSGSGTGSVPRKVKNGNVGGSGEVKKVWKVKGYNGNFGEGKNGGKNPNADLANCTTVMLKNIPNSLSRGLLVKMVDRHCRQQNGEQHKNNVPCRSQYDFLYLPFDFVKRQNLGYAFINFTTVEGASNFYTCWNNKGWLLSLKVRAITRAKLQGLDQCRAHFQISIFACISETYLPVEFAPPRNGFNSASCEAKTIGKWIKADRSFKNSSLA